MGKVRPEVGDGELVARRLILVLPLPCCVFLFFNYAMRFLCFKKFLPKQISF